MTYNFVENDYKVGDYCMRIALDIARAMQPTMIGPPGLRRGDYDTVPYQSTHNTGGTIMGHDPKTSVVNRYLQAWDGRQSLHHGSLYLPATVGIQPDRPGRRACLLVGRGDRHEISQKSRSAGARVIRPSSKAGSMPRGIERATRAVLFLALSATPVAVADVEHGKALYQ